MFMFPRLTSHKKPDSWSKLILLSQSLLIVCNLSSRVAPHKISPIYFGKSTTDRIAKVILRPLCSETFDLTNSDSYGYAIKSSELQTQRLVVGTIVDHHADT